VLQGTVLSGSPGLVDTRWTEFYTVACTGRMRLLCIED